MNKNLIAGLSLIIVIGLGIGIYYEFLDKYIIIILIK